MSRDVRTVRADVRPLKIEFVLTNLEGLPWHMLSHRCANGATMRHWRIISESMQFDHTSCPLQI
jgi:hypothetical protein